jgi:hypothetical protein
MGTRRKRQQVWATYGRKQDIRFYPFWVVIGTVVRFLYRLRHWDWKDHTPPPEPPLAEIVAKFDGPVYGLVDAFLDLIPDGRSYGGNEIGLNYQRSWLLDDEGKPGVRIETRKRDERDEPWLCSALQVRMAAFGAAWEFSSLAFRQKGMETDQEPTELIDQFPSEALSRVASHTTGFPSDTTVWRWNLPEPVQVAILRNDVTQLTLSTFGLTIEQFQDLTSHIGTLNDRPELMLKYREQADARVEEYERRLLEN